MYVECYIPNFQYLLCRLRTYSGSNYDPVKQKKEMLNLGYVYIKYVQHLDSTLTSTFVAITCVLSLLPRILLMHIL